MNVILSYPRSGNHFIRFIVEYITSLPTSGCINNPTDTYICAKHFKNTTLLDHVDICQQPITEKYHTIPKSKPQKLIFVIRNFSECITRHTGTLNNDDIYQYMSLINYYHNFNGGKIMIFYEDLITNPSIIAEELYKFLNIKDDKFLNKFLKDCDNIVTQSKECTSNLPTEKAQKIFDSKQIEGHVQPPYKNISGNSLIFHSKNIPKSTITNAVNIIKR